MLDRGLRAWETPSVIELKAWLTSLLSERATPLAGQTLLSSSMARALWEEVLSKDPELSRNAATLTRKSSSLISLSYEAYSLLKEHQAMLPSKDFYLNEEALALKRWSAGYEKRLKDGGFICPSGLTQTVAELIEKGELQVGGEVVFAGFEEISPALASLIDALTGSGVKVTLWPENALKQSDDERVDIERLVDGVELYGFSDMREEVTSAARWAREMAAQGKKTGIIVANLTQYKELIEREFASELSPASALMDGACSISETFNISMAASLSNNPIVKAAIGLLSITSPGRPIETELIWELFSSPYLCVSMEEYLSLAALDAALRRSNRSKLSPGGLSNELSKERWEALKGFKERVDSYINAIKTNGGGTKAAPSLWAGRFSAELKEFGWPGNLAELTSREFQAYDAFNELLSEFAALDDIAGSLTRREAAGRLMRMAEKSIHQPKSPETLIDVIGLNESIGFDFDALRIIGACSDVLPPSINPNPFIPVNMQRGLKLTRAVPELTAKITKTRLVRLLKGAREVALSYPERIDDKEVRVSPFFASLSLSKSEKKRESNSFRDRVLASSSLEDMETDPVVEFAPQELENLRGGTTIIKEQSACPFKAFATFRLGAKVVESPEPGLSHADRGSLVHAALKDFWKVTGDSEGLKELIRKDKLIGQIRQSVENAFEENKIFGEVNYLNLERERLRRLLKEWLTYEAEREPFKVEDVESESEIEISGLNVRFRIDRVDSIGKLGHAVIDYKTGECSRGNLLGERPKEPQMLIYNLIGPYEALAFARVGFGKCRFDAIAKSGAMLPKLKAFEDDSSLKNSLSDDGINNFDELGDTWRKVVEGLAKDFVDGIAVVDPNELGSSSACYYSYCDLKSLCRIFEADDSVDEERRDENSR